MLYRKAVHGVSGCDLIPHRTFWEDLPYLVKRRLFVFY